MQEQSIPKSLVVKFRLPRGFSFEKLKETSASTITAQPRDDPAKIAMASSSVGRLAAKNERAPSMHEPQTIVKVSVMARMFISPADTKIFNIHKSFLCHYSTFFAEHFKDTAVDTYEVRLSHHEAKCFSVLVNWLYYQKIEDEDRAPLGMRDMAHIWKLAGDFQITSLENMAIDRIHDRFQADEWVWTDAVCIAQQELLSKRATAKRLVVNAMVATKDEEKFDKCFESRDFRSLRGDVARALKKSQLGGLPSSVGEASDYYFSTPATKR